MAGKTLLRPSLLTRQDLYEVVLDALCDSDGGNNPFYRDDDDTMALADTVAEAVLLTIREEEAAR